MLGLLRRVLGKVASLSKAVNLGVSESEEGELRDLSKRLGAVKKELMALSRELMVSQPPALAMEVHELVSEAEEAIRSGQKMIRAALRGLGAASDISEASSLDTLPPPRRPVMGSLTAPIPPMRAEPPRATSPGTGGDVANLVRGLVGAQANDGGWPTFSGKYVEYPRFRKEWWAYRQTYHRHVRDKLVCRSLKEKSLASSVKILVNDIEDLRKAWGTLDICFDRAEKYIAEALEPVIKFKGYKAFDSGAVREFYSLLRAAMMGARKVGLLHQLINDQTLPGILTKMPANDWRQWAKERPLWIRGAVEEAFWIFVDQKWRDALNVATAEPAGWNAGSGRPGPRGRTRGGRRRPPRNSPRPQSTWRLWKKNPPQARGSGKGCTFADVLGALDSMLPGDAGRSEDYRRKKGQGS